MISSVMSFPSSSFCGLYMTWVLRKSAVALNGRREAMLAWLLLRERVARLLRLRSAPGCACRAYRGAEGEVAAKWKARVRGGSKSSRIELLLDVTAGDDAFKSRTNTLASDDVRTQCIGRGGCISGGLRRVVLR